jgi:hypothetical protein
MMHAYERIMYPCLHGLLRSQGLKFTATVLQGLDFIYYYNKANLAALQSFNLASVGGDPTRLKELPKAITTRFRKSALTRWVSTERQSAALVMLSDVEATEYMKQLVMDYYGAQWEHVAKLCTCMSDDSKLSYLALAYAYMANHSAGGATGDNYVRLIELVAFLGSLVQRVCIKLTAGLFQRHMDSAKFFDGKSKIDSEAWTISTRLIELTPHNRGVLQWVVSLDREWTAAMPEEYEFLQKEKGRAVSLRLLDDEDVLEECNT